ncbi:hypothetical protein LDVICp207 [lymphocystis disease virus-China]|uniref:Uncharacterized protein n=2 Tax=Lymphocystis disease virus 2 TaxID=159183 RepID=A0A6F8X0P1_9VIRU|nr:hypothetical protein LDVICp207 [lymphocystis disease virus-China]AAU11050.1 hypothetical protein [lymphocystis disease virus-China]BCB67534.1 hypothetical protein [Lymphocystis disease virus 2]
MNNSIRFINNILNTINSVFLAFMVLIWDDCNCNIYIELILLSLVFTVLTQAVNDAIRGKRLNGPVVVLPIAYILYGYIIYQTVINNYLDLLYNYINFRPLFVQLLIKNCFTDFNEYKQMTKNYVMGYLKTYSVFLVTELFFIQKLNLI